MAPSPTPVPSATPVVGGGTITHTGWRGPAANSPDSGGDGNGYEVNGAGAYADDGQFATDTNSGTGAGLTCTGGGKDKHRFSNYGFNLPGTAVVRGIEVRLDARADTTAGTPYLCIQLSWDGGATWTAPKSTGTLGTAEGTYILGGPTDRWGRAWTSAALANGAFRVRVVDVASSNARDFALEWVAVRVSYTP
jgi:hypothetical protein